MGLPLLSALRILRLSILVVGLLQLGAFAATPSDGSQVAQQSVKQTPAQLHAARPAQVAILAAKLTAPGSGKTPLVDLPSCLTALPISAYRCLRTGTLLQVDDAESLLAQVVLDQPRARDPPLA